MKGLNIDLKDYLTGSIAAVIAAVVLVAGLIVANTLGIITEGQALYGLVSLIFLVTYKHMRDSVEPCSSNNEKAVSKSSPTELVARKLTIRFNKLVDPDTVVSDVSRATKKMIEVKPYEITSTSDPMSDLAAAKQWVMASDVDMTVMDIKRDLQAYWILNGFSKEFPKPNPKAPRK